MHAAEAAAAEAAVAASLGIVLFTDLWLVLWPSLDRASKQALRCVSRAMRWQVDGSIKLVATPSSGFSAGQLVCALSRWPGVRDLSLLGGSGASDLAPLATTSLAGLTSLTVRQVWAPCMHSA
ncbi:hypothetical protein FOA52_010704 [Chlamydomonas sp. UWO 241]|nr:hypothetical protein FOA52_010704 [Chlamydomonas sp. UWO 241]